MWDHAHTKYYGATPCWQAIFFRDFFEHFLNLLALAQALAQAPEARPGGILAWRLRQHGACAKPNFTFTFFPEV